MVAAIGAAAALGGAAISASGAKSAANTQSQASREATLAQMQAQAQQRADLAPWVQSGQGANSLLNRYLGIGGVGSGGVTSMGLATGLTPDQVRQQLMSRYTTTSTAAPAASSGPQYRDFNEAYAALGLQGAKQWQAAMERQHLGLNEFGNQPGMGPGYWQPGVGAGGDAGNANQWVSTAGPAAPTTSVDENALNAAIQQYYQEQEAQNAAAAQDPTYGSLLRAYRDGAEFDSGPAYDRGADFSFTGKDLASEPGYQFGLNQGTQGIERGQASRGNFLSGAAMKELTRFNEDYAGTKFNEGFNRASSTYNTNQTGRLNEYNTNLTRRQNEWNTNLGAYNDNRNRIFNFLNGVSTLGQNSAAGTGAAALQVGNNISGNMLSSGNAQAASQVATGNALQSGINTAVNNYNSSNNLNSAGGWNNMLSQQGGGYSGYTGYTGTSDPIANLNTRNGWTG